MRTPCLANFPVSVAFLCGVLGTNFISSQAEAENLDASLVGSLQTSGKNSQQKIQPKVQPKVQSKVQPNVNRATTTKPSGVQFSSGAVQNPPSKVENRDRRPKAKNSADERRAVPSKPSEHPVSSSNHSHRQETHSAPQTNSVATKEAHSSAVPKTDPRSASNNSQPNIPTNTQANSGGNANLAQASGVSQSSSPGTATPPNERDPSKTNFSGNEAQSVDDQKVAQDSSKSDPELYGMPEGDIELAGSKHPVAHEKMVFEPGKGLAIRSENKQFGIKLRLRAQMLYSLKNENGANPATTHSFQIRRARLQFLGNFFGEHNKLKFELAVSPRDIGLDRGDGTLSKSPLLDWYFEFDKFKSITVRIGQSKIPFSRQRVISSGNLQLVDRSIANREFTLDRDVGIEIRSKDFFGMGWLRYYLGIYTAEGHSSFEFNDFGMNYLGRLEFLPMGQFKDYNEADHKRLKKPRLSIGTSYAFVDNAKRSRGIIGSRPVDGGTTDYHNVEADFMFKWYGLSVFGEGFYRNGKRKPGSLIDEDGNPLLDDQGLPIQADEARNGVGYMLQTGLFVPKTKFELALRFAQNHPTGKKTSLGQTGELGGGLSYYFARHPFKIQGDYFRLYDDGDMSDGSHVFRVQLQGAF